MADKMKAAAGGYRKGLVLGLTVAEVMVLILFVLLLLLWARSPKAVADCRSELQGQRDRVAFLTERYPKNSQQVIDDLFNELTVAKNEAKASRAAVAKAAQSGEQLKNVQRLADAMGLNRNDRDGARKLTEMVSIAEEIANEAKTHGQTPTDAARALRDGQNAIAALRAGIPLPDGNRMGAPDFVRAIVTRHRELEQKAFGHGGADFPPCWSSLEPGKPDFIYNVALTSRGMVVHDNELHKDRQAELPQQGITFDVEIAPSQFEQMTRPVFEWSKRHTPECRFYVLIVDQTADHEKRAYKEHLRTVGGHFYYYEPRTIVAAGQ